MISKANPERKAGLIDKKSDGKKGVETNILQNMLARFLSLVLRVFPVPS